MQREFVSLLVKAHGPVADSLKSGLQWWFSNGSQAIDWVRLLAAAQSHGSLTFLSKHFGHVPTASVARRLVLGPFIASLGWVEQDLGVDLQPTFARWRKEPDWRYRFAEWYANSSAAARQRPFDEAVPELELR
jgi:hypothetical protein